MGLNESIVEDAALEWFGALGYEFRHGPQMAPLADELVRALGVVAAGPASVPIYSTVTGGPIAGELLGWVSRRVRAGFSAARLPPPLALRPICSHMPPRRLARAEASPTWSGPEGSSHNEFPSESLSSLHLQHVRLAVA